MSGSKDWKEWRGWPVVWLAVLCTVSSVVVYWWGGFVHKSSPNEPWGTFGDAFGPITGLFTSLALAAAITSTILQSRELALQRQAMTDQKGEMAKQANAMQSLAVATAAQVRATNIQSRVNVQLAKIAMEGELLHVRSSLDNMIGAEFKDPDERRNRVEKMIQLAMKHTDSPIRAMYADPETSQLLAPLRPDGIVQAAEPCGRLTRQIERLAAVEADLTRALDDESTGATAE